MLRSARSGSGEKGDDACRGDLVARERRHPLSAADSRALDAHLADCASCRMARQVFVDLDDETGVERHDGARIERMAALARRWTREQTRVPLRDRAPARGRTAARRVRAWALAASLVLVGGTASATVWWWRRPHVDVAVGDQPVVGVERSGARHSRHDRSSRSGSRPSELALGPAEAAGLEVSRLPSLDMPSEVTSPVAPVPGPSEAETPAAASLSTSAIPRGVTAGGRERRSPGLHHGRDEHSARIDDAASSPRRLLRQASDARRGGDVDRALGLYRNLREQFPNSSEAVFSAVPLGGLLLERRLPRAALAEFDGYLAGSHGGVLIPEALYGRGRALGALGDRREERRTWERMLADFPDGTYGPFARRRLAELK